MVTLLPCMVMTRADRVWVDDVDDRWTFSQIQRPVIHRGPPLRPAKRGSFSTSVQLTRRSTLGAASCSRYSAEISRWMKLTMHSAATTPEYRTRRTGREPYLESTQTFRSCTSGIVLEPRGDLRPHSPEVVRQSGTRRLPSRVRASLLLVVCVRQIEIAFAGLRTGADGSRLAVDEVVGVSNLVEKLIDQSVQFLFLPL
jgi:hypothetical protein